MPFCDRCGKRVSAYALFCNSCGRQLQTVNWFPTPSSTPRYVQAAIPDSTRRLVSSRPTGISALTALVTIGGIVDLFTAVLFVILTAVSHSWLRLLTGLGVGGILLSLLSLGLLICAIVSFILAYGLWNGHGWAWTWTFISSILGLIFSIPGVAVGTGILGIVIYAAIIYYLTRTRVKVFFGKSATQYHQ